jgi:putative transposase
MNERVKFVAAYLECEESFSDLCCDFGISRKTGYKWVRRYQAEGVSALEEVSRAPHAHPNAIAATSCKRSSRSVGDIRAGVLARSRWC